MNDKPKLTMKDLASNLGLSVSVVSRVLNGKADEYRISEKTQQTVHEAAKEYGFSINQLARSLRLQKTSTIGLLIPDISNTFFSLIARAVESAARQRGYSIILCDTENDTELEKKALALLQDRSVDGLLIAPVSEESNHIQALMDLGKPVVLVDRFFDGLPIPYVSSDNFQGAYEGVMYLIEQGHKDIGYIQGIPDSKPNLERLRGYTQAMSEHRLSIKLDWILGNRFEEQDGYESAMIVLQQDTRPTALFATSAVGALGVMRACLELNLRIPEDVSIIGFDEYPYAPLLSPPLTTIAQSTQSIGEVASHVLLDWLDSGDAPIDSAHILETQLVIRDSVAHL